MKVKSGFVLREIAGQYMAVAVGTRARELHGMIGMNETAAFLWEKLQKETTEEQLAEALLEEYEIDEPKALQTVKNFLESLKEEGVLENDRLSEV